MMETKTNEQVVSRVSKNCLTHYCTECDSELYTVKFSHRVIMTIIMVALAFAFVGGMTYLANTLENSSMTFCKTETTVDDMIITNIVECPE